jgi:hypothetical protein
MNKVYSHGETPNVGDRVSDRRGRIGTVTAASNGGVFTVTWDDGAIGINYALVEKFTLVSRAVKNDER